MAERFTAAQADVEWRANTGEVEADIESLRRSFRTSTDAMSDDTLRLTIAQDKLDKALARHGPTSTQAKQAELAYRREVQAGTTAARRYDAEIDRNTRSLERFSRGALAGSGALRGLRGALAFASAGFLGGAGLIYGIRQSIDAASNLEEQISKNEQVFRDGAREVEQWSQTSSRSFGIAQDKALEYAGGIGAMLVPLGLGRKEAAAMAKEVVELAADMASFSNEDPSEMLERIRSGLAGEVEPLRRFGSILSETRVKQFAWASGLAETGVELTDQQKILARYQLLLKDTADQQGNFALTAEGAANSQRTLSALWREAQILIGQALLPGYTEVVQGLRDWLSEDRNLEELQRNVNVVVRDGGQVIRGLAAGIKLTARAVEPLIDALGGIANAVEAALILGLVLKARKAAASFGLIAGASAVTRTKVVADAAAMGVALDVATRPRNIVITSTGAGAGTAAAGGRGGRRGIPPILTGNPAIAVTTAIIATAGGGTHRGDRSGQYPLTWDAVLRASEGDASPEELAIVQAELGRYSLANAPDANMARAERRLRQLRGGGKVTPGRTGTGRGATGGTGRPGRGGRPARTAVDVELDLARAQTTPGTADDLRFLREQRGIFEGQIRELERRRNLTDKQKEELRALYASVASTQSAIDSIISAGEKEVDDRRKEAADKRKKAREERERKEKLERDREREKRERAAQRLRDRLDRREQRLENARDAAELTESLADDRKALQRLIDFYRRQARNDDLLLKERQDYASKRIAARKALQDLDKRKADSGAGKGFESLAFEFLQSLRGFQNQFGPNFTTDGAPGGRPPVNVTVNQTFPEPTPDRNTEAMYARQAAQQAFQSI